MTVFNELEERAVGTLEVGEADRYRIEVAGEHSNEADLAAGVEDGLERLDGAAHVMQALASALEELRVEGVTLEELDELDLEGAGAAEGDADAAVAPAAPVVGTHDRQLEHAEGSEERFVGAERRVHVADDEADLVEWRKVEIHAAQ